MLNYQWNLDIEFGEIRQNFVQHFLSNSCLNNFRIFKGYNEVQIVLYNIKYLGCTAIFCIDMCLWPYFDDHLRQEISPFIKLSLYEQVRIFCVPALGTPPEQQNCQKSIVFDTKNNGTTLRRISDCPHLRW